MANVTIVIIWRYTNITHLVRLDGFVSVFDASDTLNPIFLFVLASSERFIAGSCMLLMAFSWGWAARTCVFTQVSVCPTVVPVQWADIRRVWVALAEWLPKSAGG